MDLEILKEAYEALSDEKKALYVEKGGKYALDAAALAKELEAQAGLKSNHDRLLGQVKTLGAKLKEKEEAEAAAKKAADEKDLEAKKAAGSLKGITESFETKIKAAWEEGAAELAKLRSDYDKLADSLIEAELFNMASEAAVRWCACQWCKARLVSVWAGRLGRVH
ncbi:MAG: hypothetical protein LBH93_00410 [Chitinispirillales bacterium]|jgi:DNA repair exonuclease SbcCD ATPase subunit|nr:hypothetical protein [Chitinispirillales bacterium]